MNLDKIRESIVGEFPNIDMLEDFKLCSFKENVLGNFEVTPYYRCLAAYVKLFEPKRILEIGTCSGISTICLAKYADHVDTYDVTDEHVDQGVLNHPKINFNLLSLPEEVLDISPKGYDLVFIDIDHSGKYEPVIHSRLLDEYKGIAFWDDVLMPEMQNFWNSVKNNKKTFMWNRCGFGMVEYSGK